MPFSLTMNDNGGMVEKNRRNSGRIFLERIIAPSHENCNLLAKRATSDLKQNVRSNKRPGSGGTPCRCLILGTVLA